MKPHLSDEQILDRIYGLAEADSHMDACPECQARMLRMQQRREQTMPAAPPPEFFHRQRRGILDRLSAPVRRPLLVPATLAAALMLGLVLTSHAPQANVVEAPKAAVSEAVLIEAGWFEDTYSATQVMEPLAASPIRELFVEGPVPQ